MSDDGIIHSFLDIDYLAYQPASCSLSSTRYGYNPSPAKAEPAASAAAIRVPVERILRRIASNMASHEVAPVDKLQNESYGWHFQFLTILGLSISTACFACGFISDMTNSSSFFTLKNYLALVAAPIEIVISILYWGLRAIDDNLVVPPDLPFPPFLYDLGFHLVPAIVLTLDSLLLSPPWPSMPMNPQAPLIMLATSTSIAFAYWYWIELCYSHNGFYPYPIFGILTTLQRVGLFAISGATMWVAGGALRAAYAYVNGFETVEELEKVKRAHKMATDGKWE
ncbi:hypothetical protein LEMA_P063810.1 [Plenodomus lingam JN3]|uniref:Integral membrane protein n=1 Tax=Leptosphaeria maculans (strain JN3 / isolate v23.1.3 / race Av1-4-5-6-7-8) TaxID=985895 RepID=E4ZG35_LEPMJ|nr:hypothetical protein LEMA_P063810.1 [Plenodomus lingam JN3]CBX90255.1 hypothetical protein LEMA_P063810.1 [Plenodomus lingam JN3]